MYDDVGQPVTLRQRLMKRWGSLDTERSPWIRRYQEVSDYLLPFSGRYIHTDRNLGDKTFNNILDETGTLAQRVLTAGMMAGMTSPARPWFRLAVPDPDLMEHQSVKEWLDQVTLRMRDIFSRTNTYRALPMIYEELSGFATAASFITKDDENVIWHYPMTAGEYAISTDPRGRVNTVYRKYDMTVEQIVHQFVYNNNPQSNPDWSKVSHNIKNLWDTHKAIDSWRPVLHAIEPRPQSERPAGSKLSKHMPWRSTYLEWSSDDGDEKVMRDSGFKDFPVLAPRWATRGGDIYGYGPGFEALGSIKQLQQEQLRKGQAIDFMAYPPVAAPGEMKSQELEGFPGGVTFYTGIGQNQKIQNLYDVRINIQHLLEDIQDVRNRINRVFYVDLFLMISQDDRRMPATAREIVERHEEKLLMLGPVLERLHDELLSPMIDNTFTYMIEAGLLPPPPPELEGVDLKVEFISVLAQAQRAVGLANLDRLIGTVGAIAQQKGDTSIWDKVDADQLIDEYAERLAVPPDVIVADENVAFIRQQRIQDQNMMRAQQFAEMAPKVSGALKDVSEIPDDSRAMRGAAAATEIDPTNTNLSDAARAVRQGTGL